MSKEEIDKIFSWLDKRLGSNGKFLFKLDIYNEKFYGYRWDDSSENTQIEISAECLEEIIEGDNV